MQASAPKTPFYMELSVNQTINANQFIVKIRRPKFTFRNYKPSVVYLIHAINN